MRRALDLTPGEPYSTSGLEDAQQAALELGVFSSVAIQPRPEQRPPGSTAVPIDVELSGTPLQTLRLGGGLQLDTLQTGAHLLAGYDHQNFLGELRRLSLEVRPRRAPGAFGGRFRPGAAGDAGLADRVVGRHRACLLMRRTPLLRRWLGRAARALLILLLALTALALDALASANLMVQGQQRPGVPQRKWNRSSSSPRRARMSDILPNPGPSSGGQR